MLYICTITEISLKGRSVMFFLLPFNMHSETNKTGFGWALLMKLVVKYRNQFYCRSITYPTPTRLRSRLDADLTL